MSTQAYQLMKMTMEVLASRADAGIAAVCKDCLAAVADHEEKEALLTEAAQKHIFKL